MSPWRTSRSGSMTPAFLSLDISSDAAAVKLAESRFWAIDMIDFFLLSRIDDEGHIVATSFDHVGASA